MKKIIDYLTMFIAMAVFWLATAIMLIVVVFLCVAVPAALGLGFYQMFKSL